LADFFNKVRPNNKSATKMNLSNISPRKTALVSVFLGFDAFLFDRLHKFFQLDIKGWSGGEYAPLTPFLDYVMVWNTGVSYGLLSGFPQPVVMSIVGIAFGALLWWWVVSKDFLVRIGLALCLGGALSNIVDRWLYGAVADFFHLYVANKSLFVFNLADTFIFIGAVLLIIDAFVPKNKINI